MEKRNGNPLSKTDHRGNHAYDNAGVSLGSFDKNLHNMDRHLYYNNSLEIPGRTVETSFSNRHL